MSYQKIIGGMGLGYGSKYQLLRMLGWHRNDFNKQISASVGLSKDISWIDFGYSGSLDTELMNFDFIPQISKEWKDFWACGSGGINWDAVGLACDGTYILVEAKAHIGEMKSTPCGSDSSKKRNAKRIKELFEKYGVNTSVDIICRDNYQLANRLVATDFLISRGYKARLVYLLFENGYEYNCSTKKSVSKSVWLEEFDKELSRLGIKGSKLENLISICVINCNI